MIVVKIMDIRVNYTEIFYILSLKEVCIRKKFVFRPKRDVKEKVSIYLYYLSK